jgi:hypothetical protein
MAKSPAWTKPTPKDPKQIVGLLPAEVKEPDMKVVG